MTVENACLEDRVWGATLKSVLVPTVINARSLCSLPVPTVYFEALQVQNCTRGTLNYEPTVTRKPFENALLTLSLSLSGFLSLSLSLSLSLARSFSDSLSFSLSLSLSLSLSFSFSLSLSLVFSLSLWKKC